MNMQLHSFILGNKKRSFVAVARKSGKKKEGVNHPLSAHLLLNQRDWESRRLSVPIPNTAIHQRPVPAIPDFADSVLPVSACGGSRWLPIRQPPRTANQDETVPESWAGTALLHHARVSRVSPPRRCGALSFGRLPTHG